jgi:hypothetical protein
VSRAALAAIALLASACGGSDWECQVSGDPDFVPQIGCTEDFAALSSEPPSASIPGAQSVKTVVDRLDDNHLYFQNSKRYGLHWDFASTHLSGGELPLVPPRAEFNSTEYSSLDRRFLLGALSYYEQPDKWVYEIAPYDTATAEMVTTAYDLIAANIFVGGDLYFHPTSDNLETLAATLPARVKVITTDQLFEDIEYQPLNLGETMGRLQFRTAEQVVSEYLSFRDIAVLDAIPNDISVVAATITGEFQTPLAHINVLAQNRGTPNMGLRGAFDDATLRPLDGKWVHLTVRAFDWEIVEVTQAEADAWWEEHRPDPLGVPAIDLSVTDLRDTDVMLDLETYPELGDALDAIIPAFGGKASHFAGLPRIGDAVPHPDGFGIPVYYYVQFMEQNGFDTQIAEMLADPEFRGDPAVRDARLTELRDAMIVAPVDPAFETLLMDKLAAKYPGSPRIRFRSSTNAEDLDGFTGAGLYTSKTGDPDDPLDPVLGAVREVWSSVWYFRAYEEREYRGIDHTQVAMALLVHPSFPDEEANGVALTANIFDRQCLEPGFYINVQLGEESVVQPAPNVTTDSFVYMFDATNQPSVWLSHSSLVAQGETVLTRAQTYELGQAMKAIHEFYKAAYGPPPNAPACEEFYAMDIEFKFDAPGVGAEDPQLVIKQARPHPGWGL